MSVHDSFPCKDCGREFKTGEAFSDHFERESGSIFITGCDPTLFANLPKKVEREA